MKERTVYVAESDKAQREEIIKKLERVEGLRIVGSSGNGTVTVKEVLSLNPDELITSIAMPELDGYGIIEKLTLNNAKCRITVVSALAGDGFITKALNMGAEYYMVKPVDYDGLIEAITKKRETKKPEKVRDKSVEERITNIFMSVGIPAHIKGYQFLREAIKLAIESPDIINSITKKLYPTIAQNYSTSASKVERAIRHAIEVAWNKGRIENINNLFGVKVYTASDKPTNGEFIALVADKMLIESM